MIKKTPPRPSKRKLEDSGTAVILYKDVASTTYTAPLELSATSLGYSSNPAAKG